MLARGLEQHVGAERVGGDEGVGLGDGAIDVGLGGEVDDRLGGGGLDRLRDGVGVLDGAADEAKAGVLGEVVEVLLAPRVGELVEHSHLIAVLEQAQAHEVGADEAGAAADEQFHARIIPCAAQASARAGRAGRVWLRPG